MSFFGFNTDLPANLQGGEGDTLDERLRLMAEADENLEIYNWDDDTGLQGTGGLAGKLDDTLDAFNDDTFGGGGAIGRDFDFASNTAQFSGQPASNSTSTKLETAKKGAPSPFSISFDADPLLGPVRGNRGYQQTRPPSFPQPQQWGQNQSPVTAGFPPAAFPAQPNRSSIPPKARTLEEIEAEMQASRPAQPTAPALPATVAPPAAQVKANRAPLTVEEVEAEMMRKAQAARQEQPPQVGQQGTAQGHPMGRQGSRDQAAVQALAQQAQMMALRQQQGGQQLQKAAGADQVPPTPSQPLQLGQGDNLLAQLLAGPPQGVKQPAGIQLDDPRVQQTMEEHMRIHALNEEGRRRKAAKIHRMAKFNGLMTQGDKDFITRIQVSQLINSNGPNGTHDPFSDDFYFAMVQSLRQSRLAALQRQEGALGNGGPPGGPGGQQHPQGKGRQADKRMTRRENAMNRMTQQVQRLVDDAKKKPRASNISLEGALGKIAVRTRSAPRPLLQVDKRSSVQSLESHEALTASDVAGQLSSSLPRQTGHRQAVLTRKESLAAVEHLYDIVLKLEQARRALGSLAAVAQAEAAAEQAGEEVPRTARDAMQTSEQEYKALVEEMWSGLKVMEPLDVSTPHPFISLMSVTKCKKLLPRLLRHTSYQQTLVLLTLLIATFDTLDVVRDAPTLDMNPNDPAFYANSTSRGSAPLNIASQKKTRKQVELETEIFLNAAIPLVMGVIGSAQLRIVTGMLGLLVERNDLLKIAKSKPGLAFLTVFVSGAQSLIAATPTEEKPAPEQSELDQWKATFNHLFSKLSGHWPSLFPSTRSIPFGPGIYTPANSATAETILDTEDEPVWHFLAALAVNADMQQQQQLVTEVRDKVLENVMKAKNAAKQVEVQGAAAETVASAKIKNVNTLLHALGLDASQITVE